MKKVMFGLILISVSSIIAQDNFNKDFLTFEVRPCEPGEDLASPEMDLYNSNESFFIYDPVCLTNEDIESAEVVTMQEKPVIFVKLTSAGSDKFSDFTSKFIGLNAAIIVDSVLVGAPVIRAQIDSGQLIITGSFNEEEAANIAKGILVKEFE